MFENEGAPPDAPSEAAATQQAPETSADNLRADVLQWASQLSAEQRGRIDAAYEPPLALTQLLTRIRNSTRGLFVITGLWGVGKSSALQYIFGLLSAENDRDEYWFRLSSAGSILDQIIADDFAEFSYYSEMVKQEAERLWIRHPSFRKRITEVHGGISNTKYLRTLIDRGDLSVDAIPIPENVLRRFTERATLQRLAETNDVMLDLPDFGRSDRRPLLRTFNEIQDLWLKVNRIASENKDEKSGPNIIITLQKELMDLAPSYFLGKALVIEIPAMGPLQLVGIYEKKFGSCAPFTDKALQYAAQLSRGIPRRFLKFISLVLESALIRNKNEISPADVSDSIGVNDVARELEAELTSIFPKSEPRSKGARLIVWLLGREFGPDASAGPMTQKHASQLLDLEESDVSRLVDRLEANMLVTRERTEKGNILRIRW